MEPWAKYIPTSSWLQTTPSSSQVANDWKQIGKTGTFQCLHCLFMLQMDWNLLPASAGYPQLGAKGAHAQANHSSSIDTWHIMFTNVHNVIQHENTFA